jgi:hypothetical protein
MSMYKEIPSILHTESREFFVYAHRKYEPISSLIYPESWNFQQRESLLWRKGLCFQKYLLKYIYMLVQ